MRAGGRARAHRAEGAPSTHRRRQSTSRRRAENAVTEKHQRKPLSKRKYPGSESLHPQTMSVSRRKFVKSASAAVALTAIGSRAEALVNAPEILSHARGRAEDFKELAMRGVDAARSAGAQYEIGRAHV